MVLLEGIWLLLLSFLLLVANNDDDGCCVSASLLFVEKVCCGCALCACMLEARKPGRESGASAKAAARPLQDI